MLGELVPCGGGPPIPLLKTKLLVGRQDSCDVSLRFPTVSGRHCELELKDGYWFVQDLGSSNGTRVNGKKCTTQWLLPKDTLAVAQYAYTVVYTPPAARPPPPRIEAAAEVSTRAGTPAPPGAGQGPDAVRPAAPKETPPLARPAQQPAAGAPLGALIPCGGGDPMPLHKPVLVVGRAPACDIVLRSATVSTRHCQLEWADGCWRVRDLGSRNGIRVDGVPCDTQVLPPGSVLWIASLRFQINYTGSGSPPAKKPPMFAQGLLEKAGLMHWQRTLPAPPKNEAD